MFRGVQFGLAFFYYLLFLLLTLFISAFLFGVNHEHIFIRG